MTIDSPEFRKILIAMGAAIGIPYTYNALIAHIDAWRVPPGYKLAPIGSTAEMDLAGRNALRACGNDQATIRDAELCWSAMLAAAPAPDKEPPCGS